MQMSWNITRVYQLAVCRHGRWCYLKMDWRREKRLVALIYYYMPPGTITARTSLTKVTASHWSNQGRDPTETISLVAAILLIRHWNSSFMQISISWPRQNRESNEPFWRKICKFPWDGKWNKYLRNLRGHVRAKKKGGYRHGSRGCSNLSRWKVCRSRVLVAVRGGRRT